MLGLIRGLLATEAGAKALNGFMDRLMRLPEHIIWMAFIITCGWGIFHYFHPVMMRIAEIPSKIDHLAEGLKENTQSIRFLADKFRGSP